MKGIIYATRENVSHFSESLRSSLLLVAIAAFRFPIALYTGVCSIERICQWRQEEGKEARRLKPGDIVTIPANVKHWHGATANSWFSHIAVEIPGENTSNEWCEKVTDEEYDKLK